jgi:U3 small nucleolar RNA-associated protein 21
VSTHPVSEETGIIDLTAAVSSLAPLPDVMGTEMVEDVDGDSTLAPTVDQLSSSLLTLSLLPRSRWQTLLNLDRIRARNKPIAPPEKPKAAPFFLSSSLALTNGDSADPMNSLALAPKSKDLSRVTVSSLSSARDTLDIDQLLTLPTNGSSPHPLMVQLLELPPSSTALTLQTLTLASLPPFIRLLTSHLRQRRDYEVVNTYISLLLKYHSEFIQLDDVASALKEFRAVNEDEGRRLGEMVGYASGVVGGWLRSSR